MGERNYNCGSFYVTFAGLKAPSKYLYRVRSYGQEYNVVAENIKQVTFNYPDAERIEKVGAVDIL